MSSIPQNKYRYLVHSWLCLHLEIYNNISSRDAPHGAGFLRKKRVFANPEWKFLYLNFSRGLMLSFKEYGNICYLKQICLKTHKLIWLCLQIGRLSLHFQYSVSGRISGNRIQYPTGYWISKKAGLSVAFLISSALPLYPEL
jgi:hypothetical protein